MEVKLDTVVLKRKIDYLFELFVYQLAIYCQKITISLQGFLKGKFHSLVNKYTRRFHGLQSSGVGLGGGGEV